MKATSLLKKQRREVKVGAIDRRSQARRGKAKRAAAALVFATTLGTAGLALAADPTTTKEAAQSPADNSGRNVRDRDGNTLTPGDQSNDPADIALTQKIRKAVTDDDALSMAAHNVKIITINGVVTLRGPVQSQAESQAIVAKAKQIAGPTKVQNHLEVAK